MIGRRGFLSLLGVSPVAGSIAVTEAVSGAAIQASSAGCEGPTRLSDIEQAIRQAFQLHEDENPDYRLEIPASIASKKSWSPVFKESVARSAHIERRKRDTLLRDIVYGDQPTAFKLAKLAKLGIKV